MDIGLNHPDRDLLKKKTKFRRTREQAEIINELLPDMVIKELIEAIDTKLLKRESIYKLLLHKIMMVDSYRKQFFDFQLEGDFLRSITRECFESNQTNPNFCQRRLVKS